MATKADYQALARSFRRELNDEDLAFRSYERKDITDRLRSLSGEARARISTSTVADDIENAFRDQGLRIFPRLQDTDTNDWIRLWRAGTRATEMLDLILVPGGSNDRQLGDMTKKIKGTWNWTDAEGETVGK